MRSADAIATTLGTISPSITSRRSAAAPKRAASHPLPEATLEAREEASAK
jgi:hypothetical protein